MVLRHCHTYCYPWTNEDSHCISFLYLDNDILHFIHLLTPTMTWKLRYQNVKLVTIITWYTFVKKEKVRRKVGHEEGERKVEGEHFNLQNQNLEDTNNKTFMFFFKKSHRPQNNNNNKESQCFSKWNIHNQGFSTYFFYIFQLLKTSKCCKQTQIISWKVLTSGIVHWYQRDNATYTLPPKQDCQ